ncbi:hypothetical protein FZC78_19130 [Rossellomorea vietnamensis]|uniref:Phage tail tape measure protein n=1 Tax=Rossellomorea vietnamensis TaxID=218284 RepID=A0A5D4NL31_9BACI|nr:hypothetical protein FZC78_19130 [Rossellomorea vietnamensis]
MANKEKNVVLNFKMDGQVQYAETLKEINAVMNTAAKEYKNHISAMDKDAKATDKLAAEKKKLEIQMEAAQKRTGMLRAQYEEMSKSSKTTTGQLTQMYGKLLDAEKAEKALEKSMERVNEGLSEQAQETREAEGALKELKQESGRMEAENKKLVSSFKLQTEELSDNATEAEKVELAHKQLKSQLNLSERAVRNMEQQLRQTKKIYGENSTEVFKMESRLDEARTTMTKFKRSLKEVEEGSEKARKSIKELGGGMQALAGAAPAAAIGGLVTGMQEYNEVLARLKTNASTSGRDLKVVEDAFTRITAITGEPDSAGETLANLLASGFDDSQLATVIDEINGAYIRFSDTLKTEGIADGIQETLAAGEAVGPFAELLERSGVDLESFNGTLASMISIGEGSNYILKTLSKEGFSEVYNKYQELNPEVQRNAEANAELQRNLADLGVILTPLVSQVAEFTTKIIEWANENPELTAGIATGAAAIGGLIAVLMIAAPIVTSMTTLAGFLGVGIGAIAVPVALVIAGIAGLIAIGVLLYKNWDDIKRAAGILKTYVVNKIAELTASGVRKFNELRDKAGQAMDRAKEKVVSPIEDARDRVERIVKSIIGFFSNMKLSIPKIKLPRLPQPKITGSFSLTPPSVPTIKWNAKGAIFTRPTIFGQYGGQLQGGGEAGPEAAIPLNEETLGAIGKGILEASGGAGGTVEVHVYLDTEELNTKMAPGMSRKLNQNNKIKARSQGVVMA